LVNIYLCMCFLESIKLDKRLNGKISSQKVSCVEVLDLFQKGQNVPLSGLMFLQLG